MSEEARHRLRDALKPDEPRSPSVLRAAGVCLLITSASGVLLISVAYAMGRLGVSGGNALFWVGQIMVFLPIFVMACSDRTTRGAKQTSIVLLAVETYMIKWLYSPSQLKFFDEFQHLRGMLNVVAAGRVGVENPSLPISKDFPGMQSVSGTLASLLDNTGNVAGYLIAGAAHVAILVLLFILFEDLFQSSRAGGVAALVYATNASFQVFNSYFVYETLALPFLVATLIAAWRLHTARSSHTVFIFVAGMISFGVTLVSHHVTALFLMAFLLIIAVEATLRAAERSKQWVLVGFCALALFSGVLYLVSIRSVVASYFQPYTTDVLKPGTAPEFRPSVSSTQFAVPLFDRAATYLGFGVLVASLIVIAIRVRRPLPTWWLPFGLTASAFVLSLPAGKFLPFGGQIYGRSSAFTYLGVAFVIGFALREPIDSLRRRRAISLAFTAILVGGLAVAVPPFWERLPGKFFPKGFESGLDLRVLDAARWTESALGPGNNFMTDANGSAVLNTVARQNVSHAGDQLFYLPTLNADAQRIISDNKIEFAWVDSRVATVPSPTARYFYGSSNGYFAGAPTVSDLTKFATDDRLDLLYDDGEIRIFDMRRIAGTPDD